MATFLKVLGWLLIAIAAVGMVAYLLFSPLVVIDPLVNTLPAGILIALGAQLLTQGKNISESNEKRSMFYLDSCVKAYEEARSLLSDGNNDRATWIAAGRALIHAKELATSVTEDTHLRVLELHRLKYRSFFHGSLADKTAAFFFGAEDHSIPTDQAAASSTAREQRGGRTVTSTLNELSDKSLRAVWEAAQWPLDYTDPLDRGFSEDEQAKLAALFPGLHEFLEHKQRCQSASGRLFPKSNDNAL
ncbi:MAG: hypothetical protein A4S08_08670 [Proteobacteria bacterium SG_bin4]|nr:MAG: hypothetical protein A4S08_08670 [Proteobacteria bacterium SG_bin4]